MNITVSIPVKVGGYTGQRDAWEELGHEYTVDTDGETVMLTSNDTIRRQIKFKLEDLTKALDVLRNLNNV